MIISWRLPMASSRSITGVSPALIGQVTRRLVSWARMLRWDSMYWAFALSLVLTAVIIVARRVSEDGVTLLLATALVMAFGLWNLWNSGNVHVRSLAGADRHLFRAKRYERAGKFEQAIQELRLHERTFPGNVQAVTKLAWLLMHRGRCDEAIAEIEKAMSPFAHPGLLVYRALLKLRLGAPQAALEDALCALEKENDCTARQVAVVSLITLRRLEAAITATDEAPADHRICLLRQCGEALRLLGRVGEAEECFRLVAESVDGKVNVMDKIDALGHLGGHEEAEALLNKDADNVARMLVLLRRGDRESISEAIPLIVEQGGVQAASIIGDPEFSHLLGRPEVREKFAGVFSSMLS